MRRLVAVLAGAVVAVAPILVSSAMPADASSSAEGQLVSASPASGTPDVKDGEVRSIAQVGNTMVLGGTFTQAANDGSATTLDRRHLLAFDQDTGQISENFHPDPNGGQIDAVIPAGDDSSVYVSGSFTSINGVTRSNVARIQVSDGAVLPDFDAGTVATSDTGAAEIMDLRLSHGRLWLAGRFSTVDGTSQPALATVDPDTGAVDPYMSRAIAGQHNGGSTFVRKIDISPDGTKLVGIGNFVTLDGAKDEQIFMLNLSGASAAPANWQTGFYEGVGGASFNSYMRDLDFSPDGTFFVVSTTGGYQGQNSPCDTTARWETSSTGSGLTPSWVDYTGGDTTYAVEITDSAVYTGGHARWQNNPFARDSAGPGAVARPGIAALDPQSGLPFSWNPTRDRGIGVFDFLVNSKGLWVASDTTVIGGQGGRERIALLPAGGTTVPAFQTATLPNDIYLGAAGDVPTDTLARRFYDSGNAGPARTAPTGDVDWTQSTGAFMLNGQLYVASADGSFTRRSFDGTSYGSSDPVNTQDEITPLEDWHTDITNATGMFYDSKRIYFTENGESRLFYRYFNPESDVVGAKRLVASDNVSGIDFSQVHGMFGTSGQLYWAKSDGSLNRIDWQNGAQSGAPVGGTATRVSAPGNGWNARSLFLFQDQDRNPAPAAQLQYVGADSSAGNRSQHSVTIPSDVQAGDQLVLTLTTNTANTTVKAGFTGWQRVQTRSGSGIWGRAWTRTATASDPGRTVTVNTSGQVKSAMAVAAYRSDVGLPSVSASASKLVGSPSVTHYTPTVSQPRPGSWLVAVWSEKSSGATTWGVPSSQQQRTIAGGVATNKVSMVLADSNAPVPTGTVGGRNATTDKPRGPSMMYALVVSPS